MSLSHDRKPDSICHEMPAVTSKDETLGINDVVSRRQSVTATDISCENRHVSNTEMISNTRHEYISTPTINVHSNAGRVSLSSRKLENNKNCDISVQSPIYYLKLSTSNDALPISESGVHYGREQHHDQIIHDFRDDELSNITEAPASHPPKYEIQLQLSDEHTTVTIDNCSAGDDSVAVGGQATGVCATITEKYIENKGQLKHTQRKFCTYGDCKFSALKTKDLVRHHRTHTGIA